MSAQEAPLLEEVADGAPEVEGRHWTNLVASGQWALYWSPRRGTHLRPLPVYAPLNVDPKDVVDGASTGKAAVPAAPALDAILTEAAVPTG